MTASVEDVAGPGYSTESRHRHTAERVTVLVFLATEQRFCVERASKFIDNIVAHSGRNSSE